MVWRLLLELLKTEEAVLESELAEPTPIKRSPESARCAPSSSSGWCCCSSASALVSLFLRGPAVAAFSTPLSERNGDSVRDGARVGWWSEEGSLRLVFSTEGALGKKSAKPADARDILSLTRPLCDHRGACQAGVSACAGGRRRRPSCSLVRAGREVFETRQVGAKCTRAADRDLQAQRAQTRGRKVKEEGRASPGFGRMQRRAGWQWRREVEVAGCWHSKGDEVLPQAAKTRTTAHIYRSL